MLSHSSFTLNIRHSDAPASLVFSQSTVLKTPFIYYDIYIATKPPF